jgi:hypothetical protein
VRKRRVHVVRNEGSRLATASYATNTKKPLAATGRWRSTNLLFLLLSSLQEERNAVTRPLVAGFDSAKILEEVMTLCEVQYTFTSRKRGFD